MNLFTGDFERYRNMLNVPPNHHQHIANAQLMSAGNSNHGNKTRPGLRLVNLRTRTVKFKKRSLLKKTIFFF